MTTSKRRIFITFLTSFWINFLITLAIGLVIKKLPGLNFSFNWILIFLLAVGVLLAAKFLIDYLETTWGIHLYPELVSGDRDNYSAREETLELIHKAKRKNFQLNILTLFLTLVTIVLSGIYVIAIVNNNYASMKKALKGGIFILSVGYSLIYFFRHKKQFLTLGEKVGWFSGTIFGPPTVVEMLF